MVELGVADMLVWEPSSEFYEYVLRALVELLVKKGLISVDELNEIVERTRDEKRGADIEILKVLTEKEKVEVTKFLASKIKEMSYNELDKLVDEIYTKVEGREPKPTSFASAMYIKGKTSEIRNMLRSFDEFKRFRKEEIEYIYYALIILGYENAEVLEKLKKFIKK